MRKQMISYLLFSVFSELCGKSNAFLLHTNKKGCFLFQTGIFFKRQHVFANLAGLLSGICLILFSIIPICPSVVRPAARYIAR